LGLAENGPETFYYERFLVIPKDSFKAFFFFRLKRRTKMMTFLERMSCKYSGVTQVDCWLTY
jgi:hypothetical protein